MACAVVVCAALPASAHPLRYGDDPTNWQSTITRVVPPSIVHATMGDATQRLTVSVRSPTATVVIIGYNGEPFLRLRGTGAWVNERSTTTYAVAGPTARVPADADDKAPPRWHHVSRAGSWTWHDSRTHWPGYALPPPVEQRPDDRQHVTDWSVPLTVDGQRGDIAGSLDWVPGPTGAVGATLAAATFLAVLASAVVRRSTAAIAASVAALVTVDVAHSVGMVAGRVGTLGARLAALPGHGALPLVLWLSAVVAVVAMRHRQDLALYALAVIGVLVCFTEGLPSIAALWHSQLVNALPVNVDRALVAVLTGGGVGLLGASLLLLNRSTNVYSRRNT